MEQNPRQDVLNFLTSWSIPVNDEQLDLVCHVLDDSHRVAVGKSVPGSGKTTMLVASILYLMQGPMRVSQKDILNCSFNTDCADVTRQRLARCSASNPMAFKRLSRTCHSIGWEVCKDLGYGELIERQNELMGDVMVAYSKKYGTFDRDQNEAQSMISYAKSRGCFVMPNGVDTFVDQKTAEDLNVEMDELSHLLIVYSQVKGTLVDFDDQIAIPAMYFNLWRNKQYKRNPFDTFKNIRFLFIDELQDFNACQMSMVDGIMTASGCKVTAVGDEDQCLLPGTMVSMGDGSEKKIEDVAEGDLVLAHHGKVGFHQAKVTRNTRLHKTSRRMVEITLDSGRKITSTMNHMHFAEFLTDRPCDKHFVYLMKRGDRYRIGTTRMYSHEETVWFRFGLNARLLREKAEYGWILASFDTEAKARAWEAIWSLKYEIPTILFEPVEQKSRGKGIVSDQTVIDEVFDNVDSRRGAMDLLADLGMFHDRPHVVPKCTNPKKSRNIVLTMCGDGRSFKSVMHKLSICTSDPAVASSMRAAGFKPRPSKTSGWRVETSRSSWAEIESMAESLRVATNGIVLRQAFVGDGTSLAFCPASHVRPGMTMSTEYGLQSVASVSFVTMDTHVYDLDVDKVHNFVANGVVTHNSLYSWRGANTHNMDVFVQRFDATKYTIPKNYRSGSRILEAASAVIARNHGREDYRIIPARDIQSRTVQIRCGGPHVQSKALVQVIQSLCGIKEPRNIFVIGRTNSALAAAARALHMAGVPVTAKLDEFQNEYAQVLNCIAAVIGHPNANMRTALKFIRMIGEKRATAATANGVDLDDVNASNLGRGVIAQKVGGLISILRGLRDKHRGTDIKDDFTAFQDICYAIRDALVRFTEEYARSTSMNMRAELNDVVTHVVDMASNIGPVEAIDKLYEFEDLDITKERLNCVELLTAHRSKGLENEAVVIIDADNFPCAKADEESDAYYQESNLLFVAMTRAKDTLVVLRAPKKNFGAAINGGPEFRESPFYDDVPWDASVNYGTKEMQQHFPMPSPESSRKMEALPGVVSVPVESWPPPIKEYEVGDSFESFKGKLLDKMRSDDMIVYPCQPSDGWSDPAKWGKSFGSMLSDVLAPDGINVLCEIYASFMSRSIKPEEDRYKAHEQWLRAASIKLAAMMGPGWRPAIFRKRAWLKYPVVQKDVLARIGPGNTTRPVTETYAVASLVLTMSGHPRLRPCLYLRTSNVRFAVSTGAASLASLIRFECMPTNGPMPMLLWKSEKDYAKSTKKNEGYGYAIEDLQSALDGMKAHEAEFDAAINDLLTMPCHEVPFNGHLWVFRESDMLWPLHPGDVVLVEHMMGKTKDAFDPPSAQKDDSLFETLRQYEKPLRVADLPAHRDMMRRACAGLRYREMEAVVSRVFNVPSSLVSSEATGKSILFTVERLPQLTVPPKETEDAVGELLGRKVKFKIT